MFLGFPEPYHHENEHELDDDAAYDLAVRTVTGPYRRTDPVAPDLHYMEWNTL